VKSVGKKAAKYVAPLAVGLAGAAAAHYLSKSKSGKSRDVADGTDTSRFTDHTLPFANSDIESSYRDRNADRVPITPASIKALLALQALHSAYEPSVNHPWTSGGGVNWIPGKRQWDWLTGGSLVGPTTLAALAANRKTQDPEEKIRHLAQCQHCQGKGIGKDLWNGIKKVGKDIYGGAKNVSKAALPYVIPIGVAAGTAAAAYHGIPKIPGITNGTYGLKHAGQAVGHLGNYAADSAHWARNEIAQVPTKIDNYYNDPNGSYHFPNQHSRVSAFDSF
jgi:hypothetical protein